MQWLCQLGDGKMLGVESDGTLREVKTGYPYPDVNYNGFNNQMNALESLGLVFKVDNTCKLMQELLDTGITNLADIKSELRSRAYGSDLLDILSRIINYTNTTISPESLSDWLFENYPKVIIKKFTILSSYTDWGALLKIDKGTPEDFLKDFINILGYNKHCQLYKDSCFSGNRDLDHPSSADYIYFNVKTVFPDILAAVEYYNKTEPVDVHFEPGVVQSDGDSLFYNAAIYNNKTVNDGKDIVLSDKCIVDVDLANLTIGDKISSNVLSVTNLNKASELSLGDLEEFLETGICSDEVKEILMSFAVSMEFPFCLDILDYFEEFADVCNSDYFKFYFAAEVNKED